MRRMERRRSESVGNFWHAVSVELDEDEFVPYRGQLFLRGTPAWGDIFLTTKRLIWIRQRIALPLGRKLLEVPLSEIGGWSIGRAPRWWNGWTRRRGVVRIRTASETFEFVTVWTREDADDWVEALESVMADAGMLPAEAAE